MDLDDELKRFADELQSSDVHDWRSIHTELDDISDVDQFITAMRRFLNHHSDRRKASSKQHKAQHMQTLPIALTKFQALLCW